MRELSKNYLGRIRLHLRALYNPKTKKGELMRKENRQEKVDKRKKMNKHHLTPKSRGGKDQEWNLAIFDKLRHSYWHRVFGNKTLEEVIELLTRFKRFKDSQRTSPP